MREARSGSRCGSPAAYPTLAVEPVPRGQAILTGMSESSPVPRRMNGLLQMLLLTDQTLAELAAARQEDAAELGDVLRQAVGEEHSDLVRSLAEAEARCAELAGELDLARAERHRCRRDLAVAAVDAAPLPLPVGT